MTAGRTGVVSVARAASLAFRSRSAWVVVGLLSACGSTSRHPTLPPPEYERPTVIPWGPEASAAAGAAQTEGTVRNPPARSLEGQGGAPRDQRSTGAAGRDTAPEGGQTETEAPMTSGGAANAR